MGKQGTYALPPRRDAEIALRVDYHALLARQALLEKRVARRKRDAVVAALDDQVDLREERLHLVKAGLVVTEEVGAWQRGEAREDGARHKGREAADRRCCRGGGSHCEGIVCAGGREGSVRSGGVESQAVDGRSFRLEVFCGGGRGGGASCLGAGL